MPVYTVHAPPNEANPDRYVFVRDGFYVWAMLLGPLWILIQRLWLVLVLYLVALGAIGAAIASLHIADGGWITILVAILTGLEAGTLWRWTLKRRGYREVGIVVGDNQDMAERQFFHRALARAESAAPAAATVPPVVRPPYSPMPSVIGLFPEKGA